jgi:hypothetical protein
MNLSDLRTNKPIKMLLIGDSGNGKTGALVSLALAGYKLRIIDFDNGLEILAYKLKGQKDKNGNDAIANVKYETCIDSLKSIGNKIVPVGQPVAFSNALNLLQDWKKPIASEDLGAPSSWGTDTILVIDSLTFMSSAALRRVLAMQMRSGDQPQIQDWGQAMANIEDTLNILYSDTIKCHVIITSHIVYIEQSDGISKGYPSTLGNKLPPKVGRYFNQILHVQKVGSGSLAKRVILTEPQSNIDVKSPIPGLPKQLSLESGLAEFFAAASKL